MQESIRAAISPLRVALWLLCAVAGAAAAVLLSSAPSQAATPDPARPGPLGSATSTLSDVDPSPKPEESTRSSSPSQRPAAVEPQHRGSKTEQVANQVTEQVTEPVVEPVTERVVEPVKRVTAPVTERVVRPLTKPIVEPVKRVTAPVTERVVRPLTNPIVEPAEESLPAPPDDGVAEVRVAGTALNAGAGPASGSADPMATEPRADIGSDIDTAPLPTADATASASPLPAGPLGLWTGATPSDSTATASGGSASAGTTNAVLPFSVRPDVSGPAGSVRPTDAWAGSATGPLPGFSPD
ncbi:hypothetical protein [Nocardioides donggukensis]|uniref:Uncharacterized protein n=1 Tax=Nocardioides donggukensis TaxID=2774019 RepID=A0A927PZ78_9ACTN|nr:hypothetical protein [Nocardioides donggukensis]MBD8868605.1 hypothetical protein [Nocardioides donggukensis]